jgi:hypothetical protein
MSWSDGLRLALSIFLVIVGLCLGYLFLRLAGLFGRLGGSVTRVTDEVVPILNKSQTTVDGVNLELARVDEIMVSAVHATKGAERTVGTVSRVVTTPVKKVSGLAAGAREAVGTYRARRQAERLDEEGGTTVPVSAPPVTAASPPTATPPSTATPPPTAAPPPAAGEEVSARPEPPAP